MGSPSSSHLPPGKLYLVGTPIGNLEDITLRALSTLKTVDLIACEDTRRTQKLLNHYGIKTAATSYHEHNEMTRAPELILKMEEGGAVALVADAGMPGLSDPGYRLAHLAIRHKIPVVPIPGVTAMVAALAASGLPMERFLFVGFLPAKKGARLKALAALAGFTRTMVFYEAPHRVVEMLEDALKILGERPVSLARELTKVHEEFLRGSISEILAGLRERAVKGEISIVVGPAEGAPERSARGGSIREAMEKLMKGEGLEERAALKAVARERGVSRSEAYRQWVTEKSLER